MKILYWLGLSSEKPVPRCKHHVHSEGSGYVSIPMSECAEGGTSLHWRGKKRCCKCGEKWVHDIYGMRRDEDYDSITTFTRE